MKFFNIRKDGIENVVDEAVYKAIYQPAGWKVVNEGFTSEEIQTSASDEIIKKNTNKMQSVVPKSFDDGLIKVKENGKI